ncbi:unnamed protein product [Absidia cylindrospora]
MVLIELDRRAQYDVTILLSSLQQQLDIAQHENQQLKQNMNDQNTQYQKDQDSLELKMKSILQENDSLYATQERLESDLYAKEQEIGALRKETSLWKRLHKELTKSLDTEREEFDKDRSSWVQRESQLTDTIRRLQHQQQQQKGHHYRHHRSSLSPKRKHGLLSAHSASCIPTFMENLDYTPVGDECQKAAAKLDYTYHQLPSSEQPGSQLSSTLKSICREKQGTIKTQEGIITALKAKLEQQTNEVLQQRQLDNQKVSAQVENLITEVDNIKQLNQSLMEENESYQILLHEKTISGDFISDSIMQFEHDDYVTENRHPKSSGPHGLNLADELAMASSAQTDASKKQGLSTEEDLVGEIKALQDANRALQLYMNKILMRIVENKHLENILSIDEPSKGTKPPTTIIKSSTSHTPVQAPTNTFEAPQKSGHLKQVQSFSSFSSMEEDEMSASSSDTSSTKTTDASDNCSENEDDSGDSWTQVFRRMSSGFTGWTKSSDVNLDRSPSIEVDHVVRTLYCLNK